GTDCAERATDGDAGIVTDNVNLAEGSNRFERGALDRIRRTHVAADRNRFDLLIVQTLCGVARSIEIDIGERDLRPLPAEGAGKGKADAAPPAGDERRLALEVFHFISRSEKFLTQSTQRLRRGRGIVLSATSALP